MRIQILPWNVSRWIAPAGVWVAVLVVAYLAPTSPALSAPRTSIPKPVEIFVAPKGADDASGSVKAPFATLARAQRAVREALLQDRERSVIVTVRVGTYELPEPLVFGPQDSPSTTVTVTYRAERKGSVTISGGQRLTGWQVNSDGTWTLPAPGVSDGRWHPRQLFINGERRVRARTPNTGFYRGMTSDDARLITFPKGILQPWTAPEEVELVTLVEWTQSRFGLGKMNLEQRTVQFDRGIIQFFEEDWGQHIRGNMAQFPFYFENAPEMLDAPGEWHLDRRTGQLRYLPLPGETPQRATATLPRLESLVVVRGTEATPVRNLVFSGFTFSDTDWPLPRDGFLPDQACFMDTENALRGAPLPAAALDLQYAAGCVIEDCRIANVGGHGIRLREGSASNTVARCVVEGAGANGINAGLMRQARTAADSVQGNVVRDSVVRRCGLDYAGSVGIWVGLAADTVVAHNEISQIPYSGISCGWRWDRQPVGCSNNVISGNHIHRVAQLLADGGGIYVLGDQPGGVIRGNHIHDITRFSGLAHANGIFFDNGSRGWRVEDNVIHDVSDGAIRHNDNLPADQSWGTNYLDLCPGDGEFPKTLTQRAGPQ